MLSKSCIGDLVPPTLAESSAYKHRSEQLAKQVAEKDCILDTYRRHQVIPMCLSRATFRVFNVVLHMICVC